METSLKLNSFGNQLEVLLQKRDFLESENPLLNSIVQARYNNRWFTEDSELLQLHAIANHLKTSCFQVISKDRPLQIGIISEERIPLEEFWCILHALLRGNHVFYKTNEKSDKVLKHLYEWMISEIVEFQGKLFFHDRFNSKLDAYFISSREEKPELEKQYFINKKVLFEARHQSAVILSGSETDEDLKLLGRNVFDFYGQSCTSVKKVFIPENFDIRRIYEPFQEFYTVMNHHPYANNYQYQQSVYLMNRIPHYDNGFLLLKEDKAERAPTGVLFYESYVDEAELLKLLQEAPFYKIFQSSEIQLENGVFQSVQPSQAFFDFIS